MDLYNHQQYELNRLIGSLTPTQKTFYKARLDKIRRTIDIRKEALKLPINNETKKVINKSRISSIGNNLLDVEKVEELKKKLKSGDLTGLINNPTTNTYSGINKMARQNINKIPPEIAEKAILTRASTIFKRSGARQTRNYLDSNNLSDYEILPESTGEGLVIRNTKTGDVKISFRGTLIPQELNEVRTSAGDIGTDLAVMTGFENETEQFKSANELIETVKGKYGSSLNEFLGYSLGGAKGLKLGDKFGVPSTTFNPLIGKNHINADETSIKHKIFRTTEDLPSSGVALMNRDNVEINAIHPLKSNVFDIKAKHDLNNFMDSGRRRHTESHLNNLKQEVVKHGVKIGELTTLNDMINHIEIAEENRPPLPRFGKQMTDVEKIRFDSFKEPTFSDFIHKYQRSGNGVDTNFNGELLPTTRMTNKSTWGKLWKKAGGEFTDNEMEIFNQSKISENQTQLSDDLINRMVNNDEGVRNNIVQEHIQKGNDLSVGLNEAMNAEDILPMRAGGLSLGSSTAVNLLGGLAGEGLLKTGEAFAGRTISDDKNQRTLLSGGLGGGLGAVGVAKLAGEVLTGPEAVIATGVGAVSSLVGKKVNRFVKEKGGSDFQAGEAAGTVSGGTAGLLGTIGASAIAGAEAGLPLDAQTLGLASVVGAGIGASLSGLGYGLGRLGISI